MALTTTEECRLNKVPTLFLVAVPGHGDPYRFPVEVEMLA
jgi:hypothetical protein